MAESSTNEVSNYDPVKLQANLAKAGMLWQEFNKRYTEAEKNKPASPVDSSALQRATAKWAFNLAKKPETLLEANMALMTSQTLLWQKAAAKMMGMDVSVGDENIRDKRFRDPSWKESTATETLVQSYQNFSSYVATLTNEQEGLSKEEADRAKFYVTSMVEALAPNNFAITNPQVWNKVKESNGESLVKGLENLLYDFQDGELRIRMTDTHAFEIGKDVATTPGHVVFRNELIELIQYTPTTDKVRQRPLLVVPPWINKFYILDLRESNSYVKWAVEQGHTVFVISWRNPGTEQRHLSFEDYLKLGTLAAMDAIEKATGEKKLNVTGYCLGGTLMAATLAYLTAKKDDRVQSATFLTSMVDFSDPGEIGIFIDEEQVSALETLMEQNGGFLEGKNMGAAFNMLRSKDLIWSFFIELYLLGNEPMPFDLLFWNSDSTRMPEAMHSYYLRNMYLDNKLCVPNALNLLGQDIDISSIKTPVYFISAKEDHIAPWKSTYLGAQVFTGPTRFVLGGSGHIAGIINPACKNKYGHWVNTDLSGDADTWLENAEESELSWWHDWDKWVSEFSGKQVAPREAGKGKLKVLCATPGTYVTE